MAQAVGRPHDPAAHALRRVATVALLSILLGLAVQAAILAVRLTGRPPGTDLLVDLAAGVTWSALVCTGVALGLAIARGQPLLSGLLALCVAPAALGVAKASQKVMTGWLGAAEKEAVLSLGTVSILRALEYALLGWLLGRLVLRGHARPWPYLGAGAAAGLTFGAGIVALSLRAVRVGGEAMGPPALAALVINEMVFPVGCALVIFLGQSVGRHLKVLDATPT